MYEYLPIIFFIVAFILILIGYPVAFTLGGVAVIVGVWIFDVDFFLPPLFKNFWHHAEFCPLRGSPLRFHGYDVGKIGHC